MKRKKLQGNRMTALLLSCALPVTAMLGGCGSTTDTAGSTASSAVSQAADGSMETASTVTSQAATDANTDSTQTTQESVSTDENGVEQIEETLVEPTGTVSGDMAAKGKFYSDYSSNG